MRFNNLFVVTLGLIAQRCLSNIMIEVNESDGFAELGEAAIKTVTSCYAGQQKTILLAGRFPGKFIERLSESFSLVFVDYEMRAENYQFTLNVDERHSHKIQLFITIGPRAETFRLLLFISWLTVYDNPAAHILQLIWPPGEMYSGCDGGLKTVNFFDWSDISPILNTILMCQHRTKGIIMYTTDPFKNEAPEPWQSHPLQEASMPKHQYTSDKRHYYFVRQYRPREEICKNLYYDKTRDLSGTVIEKAYGPFRVEGYLPKNGTITSPWSHHMMSREGSDVSRQSLIIDGFISYVNATVNVLWFGRMDRYAPLPTEGTSIWVHPVDMKYKYARQKLLYRSIAYGELCTYVVTQHRGYKSQLRKILSVIDDYSWYGMYTVYSITWIFFVFFLRQPPFVAILNLFRLTANSGLRVVPIDAAPRVYFGCLMFFVVTMQGIFSGDLASLLTHDISVRQVDTKQDLVDLKYTIHVLPDSAALFDDPVFEGRVTKHGSYESCMSFPDRDPSAACVTDGDGHRELASLWNLHVSKSCIDTDFGRFIIPFRWFLQDRFDRFLLNSIDTGVLRPLRLIAGDKRKEMKIASEGESEPTVMTLNDLGFAFVILGIGLACAYLAFICELAFHRYHRRVTTRVLPFTLN